MSDATRATKTTVVDPESVRDFLRTEPEFLRQDESLLGELGQPLLATTLMGTQSAVVTSTITVTLALSSKQGAGLAAMGRF